MCLVCAGTGECRIESVRPPPLRHLEQVLTESTVVYLILQVSGSFQGPVAGLVGIERGVVSGVINLESSDVGASDRRPRHDE